MFRRTPTEGIFHVVNRQRQAVARLAVLLCGWRSVFISISTHKRQDETEKTRKKKPGCCFHVMSVGRKHDTVPHNSTIMVADCKCPRSNLCLKRPPKGEGTLRSSWGHYSDAHHPGSFVLQLQQHTSPVHSLDGQIDYFKALQERIYPLELCDR